VPTKTAVAALGTGLDACLVEERPALLPVQCCGASFGEVVEESQCVICHAKLGREIVDGEVSTLMPRAAGFTPLPSSRKLEVRNVRQKTALPGSIVIRRPARPVRWSR